MFIKSIVSAMLVSGFLISCAPAKKAGYPVKSEKVNCLKALMTQLGMS